MELPFRLAIERRRRSPDVTVTALLGPYPNPVSVNASLRRVTLVAAGTDLAHIGWPRR
jgi:hypothetical protein